MKMQWMIGVVFFCSSLLACYAQTVAVTFQVDMSAQTVAAAGVHIAGSFQTPAGLGANWNPASTRIYDTNGDGIYTLTVSLPPGTYEYKFINGNAWGMDENPPAACAVGNTNNRQVTVGNADLALPAVPFNGCINKLRLAVNLTGQTVSDQGVYVMGDFQTAAGLPQNWDPTSVPLQDRNADGTYEVELAVPPGTYQYVFVNGNTPENLPADCTVPGPDNLRSRSYTFAAGGGQPSVYCFNSCEACHPAVVYEFATRWWNDAVFYEIFVRSFYDSDGDGIGDFQGLIEKLDYLNDGNPDTHHDLGITGIWLMPMMASPSYHGYDVTDYYATEPDYGSMDDFEAFLDAAHARGIKVIIDLVMNHSSSQHPWFGQSANPASDYRNWYIWADQNPGNLGPWGQTIWHPSGGDFYYGLFWGGMPDLNYTHPPVKEEMFNVVDFWLDRGVDGYRLDAIKYLVEDGNVLEDTDETFALLEEFHDVYTANNPEAFTVGEVWSGTSAIIPYVQNDRLDVCFEFGLAGAILDAVNSGNPAGLAQQWQTVQGAYPSLQYATFLTNHDIDRAFSTLGGSTDKMKLAASLYLTLPGVPFVYYGEELGLQGTGDHLNLRRPMPWSGGVHGGFSSTTPWQGLGANYPTNNVATMAANPNSLLRHYQRLIQIRNEQVALRRGQTLVVNHNTNAVFSFVRVHGDEAVVVVANTGANAVNPVLSLSLSGLPAGQYWATELLGNQPLGQLTVDAQGGFANWQPTTQSLAGRSAWVVRLSVNPVSTTDEAPPAVAGPALALFPNPTRAYVEVRLPAPAGAGARVQVFAPTGQRVYDAPMLHDQLRIPTAGWSAGVYMVQLTDHTGSTTERLVVAGQE